ncbi:hypothetical protein BpHYR1_033753 [Brachionus plicatilis]|uniref:Uncharacterized protein n=1 Tax=Brachionus plicatilis TaxID=10195 RepID=A0A3M7T260_BRAPC|nr:hypothetical protein BpHYR1_033753 [Brachionus plicatilis]
MNLYLEGLPHLLSSDSVCISLIVFSETSSGNTAFYLLFLVKMERKTSREHYFAATPTPLYNTKKKTKK